jgi:sensor histidine kinase YesM
MKKSFIINRFLNDCSMQEKFTFIVAIIIILLFLITLFGLDWVKSLWEKQILIAHQKDIQLVAKEWTQILFDIQKEASRLASDPNITAYLRSEPYEYSNNILSSAISKQLFFTALNLEYTKSLCIIKSEEEYIVRNLYRYYFSDIFVHAFLNTRLPYTRPTFEYFIDMNNTPFLLFIQPTYSSANHNNIGYLLLHVDILGISKVFYQYDKDYSNYLLLDRSKKIIYTSYSNKISEDLYNIEYTNHSENPKIINSDNNIIVVYSIQNGEWTVVQIISRVKLFSDVYKVKKTLIFMFSSICIIFYFILRKIFSSYTMRINRLNNIMSTVMQGNINNRYISQNKDEIGQLGQHFNEMLDQLQELVINVSLKETHLREAQLQALRHQISPHFLYNTLETIRMIAVQHDDKDIKEISQNLSEILRYSLDEKSNLSTYVGEELTYLQRYVDIQKVRFPNRFSYTFDIDEKILSMRTYKFLLQPLLENAFKHGISRTLKSSHLLVKGRFENNLLVFTVADTGIGMDSETLEDIRKFICQNNRTSQNVMTGIGLKNVINRIRLYFGDDGQFFIESSPQQGTSITIKIPPIKSITDYKKIGLIRKEVNFND